MSSVRFDPCSQKNLRAPDSCSLSLPSSFKPVTSLQHELRPTAILVETPLRALTCPHTHGRFQSVLKVSRHQHQWFQSRPRLRHFLLENLRSERTPPQLQSQNKKDVEDIETCVFLRPCSFSCGSWSDEIPPDLTPDQPLTSSILSQHNQPPSPTVLGVMMLSFACRSLSRHGELIL